MLSYVFHHNTMMKTTTLIPNVINIHLVSTDKTGIISYWQTIAEFPQHNMKYGCNIKSFFGYDFAFVELQLEVTSTCEF